MQLNTSTSRNLWIISSALYRFDGMVQISSFYLFITLDLDQEFRARSVMISVARAKGRAPRVTLLDPRPPTTHKHQIDNAEHAD